MSENIENNLGYLENFPTEMLEEIFSYLAENHLKRNVLLVCKRWYKIVKTFPCMKYRTLTLSVRPPPADLIYFLQNTDYIVNKLILNDPIFEIIPEEFWTELGKTVEDIRFNRCTGLEQANLLNILKKCPHLRCLHFVYRFPELRNFSVVIQENQKALRNLENITELNIHSNVWMNMSPVEQLVRRMPKLRHFGLWCLGITPVNDIMKVIRLQPKTIKSLSLRHCRTNNGTTLMEKLTNLPDLSLEEFTFNILWIDESAVKNFFNKHKNIKKLYLRAAPYFPDWYFNMFSNLTQLTDLTIEIDIYASSRENLKKLFQIKALRILCISCLFVQCIGIHQPLEITSLQHLQVTFDISCEICLENLFYSLRNLKSLSIPRSTISGFMIYIFKNMKNLKSLDISYCHGIKDNEMTGVELPQQYDSVKPKKAKLMEIPSLKSVKGLKFLNLTGCAFLTDRMFKELGCIFYDMTQLNAGGLYVTLTGFEAICDAFPNLEVLQIHDNPEVDATVLKVLLTKLPNLKEIDISQEFSKNGITTTEIEIMALYGKNLKTIFALERNILDTQVVYLFQKNPTLMSVNHVKRETYQANGKLNEILNEVPSHGIKLVSDDAFVKGLEQIRRHNTAFLEPIDLNKIFV